MLRCGPCGGRQLSTGFMSEELAGKLVMYDDAVTLMKSCSWMLRSQESKALAEAR
jgi:hypothetical protein